MTSYPVNLFGEYNPHIPVVVSGSAGKQSPPMLNLSKASISEGISGTDVSDALEAGILPQVAFGYPEKSPNLQRKGSDIVSKSGGYFVGNA